MKSNAAMMFYCLIIGGFAGYAFRGPAPPPPMVPSQTQTIAEIDAGLTWPMPTKDNSITVHTNEGPAIIFGPGRERLLYDAYPKPAEALPQNELPLPEILGPGQAGA